MYLKVDCLRERLSLKLTRYLTLFKEESMTNHFNNRKLFSRVILTKMDRWYSTWWVFFFFFEKGHLVNFQSYFLCVFFLMKDTPF